MQSRNVIEMKESAWIDERKLSESVLGRVLDHGGQIENQNTARGMLAS